MALLLQWLYFRPLTKIFNYYGLLSSSWPGWVTQADFLQIGWQGMHPGWLWLDWHPDQLVQLSCQG